MRVVVFTIVAILVGSISSSLSADEMVQSDRGLVIAGHPIATRLGMDVIKKGGNAVDALVTVSLALGVTEPGNSGLGGKMVLLYYDARTKQVTCITAMDAAPLQGIDELLKLPAAQRDRGWPSVCTPGLAAGLGAAHEKFGSRPWKELVLPAVDLSEKGFQLSQTAADMMAEFPAKIDPIAAALYAPQGKHLAPGATFRNPDLAATMRVIAEKGWKSFYDGPLAEKFIEGARKGSSPLTLEDLKNYKARVMEPLVGTYKDFTVYSSAPPLTGGATLLTTLKVLEGMDWTGIKPRDSRYIDTVGRALQQVYPEVQRNAADFDGSLDKVKAMLSPENIKGMIERAKASDPKSPLKAKRVAMLESRGWDDSEQASTTHLMIVDRTGNIACCTQSLGLHFGAGVIAPGTGYLLNADFNNFSTTQSSPNYIEPGKWPRSTMTPTIFVKNGKPVLVIGSPAGQRIPTAVLQVSLDVLDFKRDLREAIRAPRFHVRRSGENRDVDVEKDSPAGLEDQLNTQGWSAHRRGDNDYYFGSVNAAVFTDKGMTGVADQRRTSDAGATE